MHWGFFLMLLGGIPTQGGGQGEALFDWICFCYVGFWSSHTKEPKGKLGLKNQRMSNSAPLVQEGWSRIIRGQASIRASGPLEGTRKPLSPKPQTLNLKPYKAYEIPIPIPEPSGSPTPWTSEDYHWGA